MGKAENPVSEVIGQFSKIMERLLPVGSIIEWAPVEGGANVDLTTPQSVSNYYGFGTWEAYGSGQMLLGVSDGHAIGSTGGEETHTLTIDEMPSHNHSVRLGYGSGGMGSAYGRVDANNPANQKWGPTGTSGGGQSHNNMPPYITVYRWRRTA